MNLVLIALFCCWYTVWSEWFPNCQVTEENRHEQPDKNYSITPNAQTVYIHHRYNSGIECHHFVIVTDDNVESVKITCMESTAVLRKNKALFQTWKLGKQKSGIIILWDAEMYATKFDCHIAFVYLADEYLMYLMFICQFVCNFTCARNVLVGGRLRIFHMKLSCFQSTPTRHVYIHN